MSSAGGAPSGIPTRQTFDTIQTELYLPVQVDNLEFLLPQQQILLQQIEHKQEQQLLLQMQEL